MSKEFIQIRIGTPIALGAGTSGHADQRIPHRYTQPAAPARVPAHHGPSSLPTRRWQAVDRIAANVGAIRTTPGFRSDVVVASARCAGAVRPEGICSGDCAK
jgi:hypothetical protein